MSKLLATARKRRLAMELLKIRKAAELPRKRMAEELRCDISRISRIEDGKAVVSSLELSIWLSACGVQAGSDYGKALERLRKQQRHRGWWMKQGDLIPPKLQELISLEESARVIFEHRQVTLPGLLQTPEYADAMIRSFPVSGEGTAEEAVAVRMQRQEVFHKQDGPRAFFVLDEAALHRVVGGPKVMKEQLDKLVKMSNAPYVNIQVLPYDCGVHESVAGSFCLFSYTEPSAMDVALVEYLQGRLVLEDDDDVEPFRRSADLLKDQALGTGKSKELIRAIAQNLYVSD
ncbi:helix-turn-helix domain-containing protein [Streptomyces boncukensis]|uniref:Helix-turn-helix domain-containing protein n=1 Tax=Streptomyces boncukensis TaxID=2711219 RepID=A0A6G4WXS4_9ACTN|nr:helix-turn-helix transcriptional regulator [Streptomyces boncukensis]NGO69908.1 helix-turn-helix domain-containing protein [Streptomyces boncukensis]